VDKTSFRKADNSAQTSTGKSTGKSTYMAGGVLNIRYLG